MVVEPVERAKPTQHAETAGPAEPPEAAQRTNDVETENLTQTREQPVVKKAAHATHPEPVGYVAPAEMRTSMELQAQDRLEEIISEGEKSPTSPGSPKGVRSWLKTKFARRRSKGEKFDAKEAGNDKAFVGAAASIEPTNETSIEPQQSSLKDVALAGKPYNDHDVGELSAAEERAGRSKRRASSVSSLSTGVEVDHSQNLEREISKDEDFEEAQDHFDEALAPPPTFAAIKSASPVRDSKFHEVM